MNVHAVEMESLARQLWGAPNERLSTRDEIRFGDGGSKSLKPKTGEWYDHKHREGGGYRDLYAKVHGSPPPDPDVIAAYDYRDADGDLLFQVVRRVPKAFVQRRPDSNGGWTWSTRGIKRVPYRLPELITANRCRSRYSSPRARRTWTISGPSAWSRRATPAVPANGNSTSGSTCAGAMS